MAKPTMLQSLLGRPSQTYSFPQEKAYFSNKRDMVRIATETQEQGSPYKSIVLDNDNNKIINAKDDVTILCNDRLRQLSIADTENNNADESSDSDRDIFYTPNTSPRTSMASSITASFRPPSPAILATKTSLTHANISTTSISSSILDGHSLFSITSSSSTPMSTPVHSESGQHTARVKVNHQPPHNANEYVAQEWAKDVRWLVPPTAKATTTSRRQYPANPDTRPPKAQIRTKPNTPISKTISKATPSIMSSMTALLEEDELQVLHQNNHPRSSVLISTPRRTVPRARMGSNPIPAPTSLPKYKQPSSNTTTLNRRRSRSLEYIHASHAPSTSLSQDTAHTSSSNTSRVSQKVSKYSSSSADPYDPTSTSLPTFTPGDLPSHGTPGYTSLVLPRAPVPLSQASHRPKGIFSLGTNKDLSSAVDADGKVDLTRSGIAQTTMASVEVVRGLSGSSANTISPNKKIMKLFRRSSTSAPPSAPLGARPSRIRGQSEDIVSNGHDPVHESPLGFTSYRAPPKYVPSESVLVQVWAVAVDSIDGQLVLGSSNSRGVSRSNTVVGSETHTPTRGVPTPPATPKRSISLRSTLGRLAAGRQASPSASDPGTPHTPLTSHGSRTPAAGVGYIPGRSFIGRILECGWEVGEDVGRRGDWVVGLLDVRKCGALTEFIVVDRHRIHRAPHPHMSPTGLSLTQTTVSFDVPLDASAKTRSKGTPSSSGPSASRSTSTHSPLPSPPLSRSNSTRPTKTVPGLGTSENHIQALPLPLTLEELSLLPICGIPAYRAVRTFMFAFSNVDGEQRGGSVEGGWDLGSIDGGALSEKGLVAKGKGRELGSDYGRGGGRRRVLVLRGHVGAGAMAVQMLVKRGWRVCVHVPFASLAYERVDPAGEEGQEGGTVGNERKYEYCMRKVEDRIRLWGGEEVIFDDGENTDGMDEQGAVVRVIDGLCSDGDVFDAILDTVGGKEVWEASERLLKSLGKVGDGGSVKKEKGKHKMGVKQFTTLVGDSPGRAIPTAGDNFRAGLRSLSFGVGGGRSDGKSEGGKVGYAWVNMAQDVDWEGEDIKETLGAVLRTTVEDGIRPWVGERDDRKEWSKERVVTFEKAPGIFVDETSGILADGGTVVVKIVG